MKKAIVLTLALVGVAVVAAATALARPSGPAAVAAPASCSAPVLGVAAPLTGPAAFLGQEQLSWVQFAASRYNKQNKTKFKIKQGDTQLSASLARTVGRQLVSDKSVLGVIGASTSQGVISSAGLYKKAGLASVSGSATRTDLTRGQFPTFFRVVPNDSVQAPNLVNYATSKLGAKKVVVMDSQDDYSLALASAMGPLFRKEGVDVQRESVAATDTDFSSIVSKVGDDVKVVVFATQTASAAQTLSQQLREQGKSAVVFGTDGAYSPSQYKPKLGYVSSFANDIRFIRAQRSLVAAYDKFSKGKSFGTFGPPSYVAATVLMDAVRKSCADGKVTRTEVTRNVKKTNAPSILGGKVRFTAKGDVAGAKFYIFKISSGKYQLVG